MTTHAYGDPRRPDGDLVAGVLPYDRRTDDVPDEVGPQVGVGHDTVFRPSPPDAGVDGDLPQYETDDDTEETL